MDDDGTDTLPCPELASRSCSFHVTTTNSQETEQVESLSLFQSRLVSNNSAGVLFAGGHISALSFHPTISSLCALAAHSPSQPVHELLTCFKGHAHIQLWSLSLQPGFTHCIGVIPHNGNCTWDLKWRPHPLPGLNSSERSVGTLAAALGDGTAIVATFEDFNIPDIHPTSSVLSPPSNILTLHPKIITLRAHVKPHVRHPVRAVEWSPDGTRLVLAIANGTVEVYEAATPDKTWPRWSIPVQDSVIMAVRWLNHNYFCSVSIACALRVCDMRDPTTHLEQNNESLMGCRSVVPVEPSVAIAGTECGTLRVLRLQCIDGVAVKQPVKRIYLQKNSVRDLQCVVHDSSSTRVPFSLVYAGGTEGILHEVVLPRPLWPRPETCHLDRAGVTQKLRWRIVDDSPENDDESLRIEESHMDNRSLHLHIGHQDHRIAPTASIDVTPDNEKEKFPSGEVALGPGQKSVANGHTVHSEDGSHVRQSFCEMKSRKKRSRVPGPNSMDRDTHDSMLSLFGDDFVQKITVTRVAVSRESGLVAVGIDEGMLTWMAMFGDGAKQPKTKKTTLHFSGGGRNVAGQEGGTGMPKKVPKVKIPGRKRGRPRKHPLPLLKRSSTREAAEIAQELLQLSHENSTTDEGGGGGGGNGHERSGKEEGDATENMGVDAKVVFGPKKKRGRPRKYPLRESRQKASGGLSAKDAKGQLVENAVEREEVGSGSNRKVGLDNSNSGETISAMARGEESGDGTKHGHGIIEGDVNEKGVLEDGAEEDDVADAVGKANRSGEHEVKTVFLQNAETGGSWKEESKTNDRGWEEESTIKKATDDGDGKKMADGLRNGASMENAEKVGNGGAERDEGGDKVMLRLRIRRGTEEVEALQREVRGGKTETEETDDRAAPMNKGTEVGQEIGSVRCKVRLRKPILVRLRICKRRARPTHGMEMKRGIQSEMVLTKGDTGVGDDVLSSAETKRKRKRDENMAGNGWVSEKKTRNGSLGERRGKASGTVTESGRKGKSEGSVRGSGGGSKDKGKRNSGRKGVVVAEGLQVGDGEVRNKVEDTGGGVSEDAVAGVPAVRKRDVGEDGEEGGGGDGSGGWSRPTRTRRPPWRLRE